MLKEGSSCFIDANILIYISQAQSPFHTIAQKIIQHIEQNEIICTISNQILREYFTIMTRPDEHGVLPDHLPILRNITRFEHYWVVLGETREVREQLYTMVENIPIADRQIHDANIVATMLTYGVKNLLTNNPKDFKRFDSFINTISLLEFYNHINSSSYK